MNKESITEETQKQKVMEIATMSVKGLCNLKSSSCRHLRQKLSCDMDFLRWSTKISKEHNDKTIMVLRKVMPRLEKAYSLCNSELKKLPHMPAVSKLPRIYIAVLRFYEASSISLQNENFNILFDILEEKCSLSLYEYFSAKAMFYAALISLTKKLTLESNTVLLEKISECLSFVSTFNFDLLAEKSTCAKILSQDPSGIYPKMTEESRLVYLHLLCKYAKKHKVNDIDYAKKLLSLSRSAKNEKERHIGYTFYKKSDFQKKLYFCILFILSISVTVFSTIIVSPLCLLAFFPVWESVRMAEDFVFSFFTLTLPLPRMKIDKIPKDGAVLVVISSLLSGEKNDSALFDRLSQIYHSNAEDNVYFGLLSDIPDGKYAKDANDEKIISYAYGRIASLNKKYGNRFILFERRRSFCKTQDKFMGWERKRGAVIELVKLLKGKNTTFSSESQTLAREILGKTKIKYIVTLDRDTNLPIGTVQDMYSCMEHPQHTPFVDKNLGIVTDGYAVMQPVCTPELISASRTPFSRLFSSPALSFSHFCTYQNIFGESIFCGKGIFNLDAFYTVICENCTFPEDKTLNHSCPEGEKLRTALITDIEITESFPSNELSYLKSRHKRIRGDIQNLIFLFDKIRFDSHDIRKNTIKRLSKFKLFDNIRTALLPCFTFVCVFISAFILPITKNTLLLLSLSYYFVPVLLCLYNIFRESFNGKSTLRFFSKGVLPDLIACLFRFFFLLSILPSEALYCFDAIGRSLYRMYISGKNLLEWQTDVQNDSDDGSLLMFVHKNIFSFFSGFVLFVFTDAGILRFISLLWFAFPIIAYHTSKQENESKEKNDKYNPTIRKYARDIWKYFSDNINENENFLPPDNINIPKGEICHKTSPTNIGFFLLSVLCARDFGFINTQEMLEKISHTLDTLEKLPKWNGHLYNQYSTESLKILPPYFVSTLDNGNLTACLITLGMGLREYVYENTEILTLIKRIEQLDKNCNYTPLYNSERNLFLQGATINKDGNADVSENCIDLYMSKTRIVSFIECARRNVPKKHWASLSRTLTGSEGYIGLLSFNGTASEYFIPQLFLPSFKNSLCFEALHFTLMQQKKYSVKYLGKALWGISDSQCYEKNESGDYKYKTLGVKSLALSLKEEKQIISPYSSFLTMCISKKDALSNLENIKKLGFYGKYGFYEAIDFTKNKEKGARVVKSYMAYHLGISLVALCNAKFDNIMSKRFLSDSKMMSGTELLCEKIPAGIKIKKDNQFI